MVLVVSAFVEARGLRVVQMSAQIVHLAEWSRAHAQNVHVGLCLCMTTAGSTWCNVYCFGHLAIMRLRGNRSKAFTCSEK